MGMFEKCLVHRILLAIRKGDRNLYTNMEAYCNKIVCMMLTMGLPYCTYYTWSSRKSMYFEMETH